MKPSFVTLAPWIALGLVLVVTGVLAALRRGKKGESRAVATPEPAPVASPKGDERLPLRSSALDALAEAVLILDREAQVRDCNTAALTLFDRHRGAIEQQAGSTLRRFEVLDQDDPHRVASQHAVWAGEAWVRQPDGGVKLCLARVIAIRDPRARVIGFVESFRDVSAERALTEEVRDLLYGVRSYESVTASPSDMVRAIRDDLRLLSEAFRDLDLVIRQYERLLPSLGADDPLAETIAGVAHDARSAVAAVGVPALLEEIPRTLTHLRGHLQQLLTESDGHPVDAAVNTETTATN